MSEQDVPIICEGIHCVMPDGNEVDIAVFKGKLVERFKIRGVQDKMWTWVEKDELARIPATILLALRELLGDCGLMPPIGEEHSYE